MSVIINNDNTFTTLNHLSHLPCLGFSIYSNLPVFIRHSISIDARFPLVLQARSYSANSFPLLQYEKHEAVSFNRRVQQASFLLDWCLCFDYLFNSLDTFAPRYRQRHSASRLYFTFLRLSFDIYQREDSYWDTHIHIISTLHLLVYIYKLLLQVCNLLYQSPWPRVAFDHRFWSVQLWMFMTVYPELAWLARSRLIRKKVLHWSLLVLVRAIFVDPCADSNVGRYAGTTHFVDGFLCMQDCKHLWLLEHISGVLGSPTWQASIASITSDHSLHARPEFHELDVSGQEEEQPFYPSRLVP